MSKVTEGKDSGIGKTENVNKSSSTNRRASGRLSTNGKEVTTTPRTSKKVEDVINTESASIKSDKKNANTVEKNSTSIKTVKKVTKKSEERLDNGIVANKKENIRVREEKTSSRNVKVDKSENRKDITKEGGKSKTKRAKNASAIGEKIISDDDEMITETVGNIDIDEEDIDIDEDTELEGFETNIVIQSKDNSDDRFNTISLDEIRDALETKIDSKQRKKNLKEALLNIGMAIIMVAYLIIIIMGSKNIDIETLEKDMKIMTLSILAIGVVLLEFSYKKDSTRLSVNSIEVVVFGAINLCLVYTVKLYLSNLVSIISYISIGIGGYYILKSIILSRINIRKFKKDNNDIKEIIKK